jgi:amidophosphoribosyltransferase
MCGFVGLIGVQGVAHELSLGLAAIQHRGQDAAGLGVYQAGSIRMYKDVGMVSKALPAEVLDAMPGTSGIAHVRYPTFGGGTREDAQPFMTRRPSMVLAHNGNITNVAQLEEELVARGVRMTSRCDSEPVLLVLGDELLKIRVAGHTTADLVAATEQLMKRLRGSYSAVAVAEIDGRETLIAFRDPHGIRPCVYGVRPDGAWAVASESVSLDVLGCKLRGDVEPGHLVLMRTGEEPEIHEVLPKPPRPCVFEHIYFARPDSRMGGHRVYTRRRAFGERLADEWKAKGHQADVVVAVPDTSRPAAMAIAERLELPNREGFIKNRYSGRTFIMPDQRTRELAHRLKLNPIEEIFQGQRVLMVDDSIVRGTTMRRIVQMVRTLNPVEVHLAIFSPPVRHPCYYGIDMPSRDELVAARLTADEDPQADLEDALARYFGTDSVTFLSIPGMKAVAGNELCAACFTGNYVVPVSAQERGYIVGGRR